MVRRFPLRARTAGRIFGAAALLAILALSGASVVRADPPTGDFTFSPAVAQVGGTVSFSSTASDVDDPSLAVSWDFGDGSPAGSGLTATHSYTSSGDKTVTMTMNNGIDPAVVVTHTVHVNAPPVASFIFTPQTPVANQQVQFSSTSTDPDPGDTLHYSWDLDGNGVFGDSTSASPKVVYSTAGTYQVGLKVTDSSGATNTVIQPVTIQNSQPSGDFSFSPAVALPGQPATFTASATPSAGETITAIDWDFGYSGTPSQFQADATGTSVTHAFAAPGTYSVAARVTESGGGYVIVSHTVTVDAPPAASFTFTPSSPLAGDTVTFASSSTDPDSPIVSTSWDLNGDGSYGDATGSVVSEQFNTPGTYTVGLRVTDAQGATAFEVANLTVRPVATTLGVLPNVLIQMAGSVTGTRTTVKRLYVRAPAGAMATISCRGRECRPHLRSSRLSRGRRMRFRGFERKYRAGAKIVVTLTMPGFVDRVTSFKMRAGRPPRRLDRCRLPGHHRLTRCAV